MFRSTKMESTLVRTLTSPTLWPLCALALSKWKTLISAPYCPSATKDLVLDGGQLVHAGGRVSGASGKFAFNCMP